MFIKVTTAMGHGQKGDRRMLINTDEISAIGEISDPDVEGLAWLEHIDGDVLYVQETIGALIEQLYRAGVMVP